MFTTLVRRALRALSMTPTTRARRLVAALATAALFLVGALPVAAGQPIDINTLNPVPPDIYTCSGIGNANGAVCFAHTVDAYENEATGLICGTGAGAYEVLDSGIRDIHAKREYDRDGNLTRRIRNFLFRDAHFSNPLNGHAVYYSQQNTDIATLTIPGDLDSAVTPERGHLTANVPGIGPVIHESHNQSDLIPYFEGDDAAIAKLCAALA
jgi:hypothetical protein